MSYNGWKNYETWVTRIEKVDDGFWLELAKQEKLGVLELADALREGIEDEALASVSSPFSSRCVRLFLREVDFDAIARSILDE